MTAHLAPLDALAASLPPGAVLAHVVTEQIGGRGQNVWWRRTWVKIGDEPWRSVSEAHVYRTAHLLRGIGDELAVEWRGPNHPAGGLCRGYRIVTPSVRWEQNYGLRGRHEVMGVVG